MKILIKIILLIIGVIYNVNAQAPKKFNYQAVARDANGNFLKNTNVTVDITIEDANRLKLFSETHITTTNNYGLFTLSIGSNNPVGFENINWANGIKYVQISVNGHSIGEVQLLSVPYALYANQAADVKNALTSFNGISKPIQTFKIDSVAATVGFASDTTSATHTLTIPTIGAAGVNKGVLSKRDYDSFKNAIGVTISTKRIKFDNTTIDTNAQGQLMVKKEGLDSTYLKNKSVSFNDLNYVGTATEGKVLRFTNGRWRISNDLSIVNVKDSIIKINSHNWSQNGNVLSDLGNSSEPFIGSRNLYPLIFKTNNIEAMRIAVGGDVYLADDLFVRGTVQANSFNNISDQKFKKEITTINNSLAIIQQLKGVSYAWRRDEFPDMKFKEGRDMGLIAQEVEKILPEIVSTHEQGFKSIAYTQLIAVLIEGIKEQQKQIERLSNLCIENDKINKSFDEKLKQLELMIKSDNYKLNEGENTHSNLQPNKK